METMLLKDPVISPTKRILEDALDKAYPAYEELIKIITSKEFDLIPEWHYYNDGKAWLCKVQYKKKTVFWLSVWENYFRIVFYLTERNANGIQQLAIDKNIKMKFAKSKAIGKLYPLAVEMKRKSQLKDLLRVIEYKKSVI